MAADGAVLVVVAMMLLVAGSRLFSRIQV
jgi:hypothetical protein